MYNSIQSNPLLNLFPEEDIDKIHAASLELLERTGVEIHHPRALELLDDAGARIHDGDLVKFPSHLIQEAVSSAPERVTVADRLGERTLFLEGSNVYYGTGSDLKYTYDVETGERRPSTLQDIEMSARVADGLKNIDFLLTYAMANELDQEVVDLHHFYAMTKNSVKPMVLTPFSSGTTKTMLKGIYEVATEIAGGERELESNPFIILYGQFTSPFQHGEMDLERLLFCSDHNLPIVYAPTIMASASGPATLAGSLAIGNAEILAGLTISQLNNPGAPFIYGGHVAPLDPRTSVFSYGNPEWHMSSAALMQLSNRYRLPSWSTGGCTDSKLFDGQAVGEAVYSILLSGLSGANLVHDVGYLESGLAGDLNYVAALDEFIGLTRKILSGYSVDEERLAVDLIDELGPGGDFLSQRHTVEHFKEETWIPGLLDRQGYMSWEQEGAKTFKERANEKVEDIIENHEPEEIAGDKREKIEEIIARTSEKARQKAR
ncbi:MAG: trimethylamine methyltransferase family protein [Candidatus Bipolaricaulota bacterium]